MKKNTWKRNLRILSLCLFIFFSNPFLANEALKAWEGSPTPYNQLTPHDLGIVLTGITNRYKLPRDRVYMEHGADRILHAIDLYKKGLIKKLLISGGSGKLIDNPNDVKEADELKKVAVIMGVKNEDILIENKSRNTYESAMYCRHFIEANHPNSTVLLITSGFHLPRAKACFAKQKLKITSFGTDYYAIGRSYALHDFVVPKSYAIRNWEKIIKEWMGIVMYWVVGYI